MSHVSNIYSPPGTPMEDRTVGEIVAERPAQSRVFQSYGIDFCCQGARTLRQACEKKGVNLESVIEQLEAELREKPAPENNPADLGVVELVDHIVDKHHQFLKDEIPRVHAMATRVAQVHGGHTPSLIEVLAIYEKIAQEMDEHMMKEEEMLFPIIARLGEGEKSAMPLDGPISAMMDDHDHTGADFEKLREITNGFQPPAEACNTYRALFAGLAEMEEDMHTHIHLENAVLFPAAKALAAS